MADKVQVFDRLIVKQTQPLSPLNEKKQWDWYTNQIHTIFLADGSKRQVRLPYYDANSPVRQIFEPADMSPKNGWELLSVDLGSEKLGNSTPRFFLYNRYRGILRFFFYYINRAGESFSTCLVKMMLGNNQGFSPLCLSFYSGKLFSSTYEKLIDVDYLDNFDPSREITAITQLVPDTWNYADFYITGYDPEISEEKYLDAAFEFTITGFNEFDLQIDGKLSLRPLYSTGTSNFLTDLSEMLSKIPGEKIAKVIKSWGSKEQAKEELIEKAKENGQTSALTKLVNIAATGASFLPQLGVAAGVLGNFMGGSSDSKFIGFDGDIKLTGKITEKPKNLRKLHLRVPRAKRSSEDNIPRDISIGVFNLKSKPILKTENYEIECQPHPYGEPEDICDTMYDLVLQPVEYVINPDITKKGETVRFEVALTNLERGITITEYVDVEKAKELSATIRHSGWDGNFTIRPSAIVLTVRIIIEAKNLEPIYIYKNFDVLIKIK